MQIEYLIKKQLNTFDFWEKFRQTSIETDLEIYLVGGYIRDIILGRDEFRHEMDFLVLGDGVEFAKNLAKKFNIKEINTFRNFGTAHFKYKKMNFEFVGARKESYNFESRNPIVAPGSLDDDINRRDFTINAIAISIGKTDFGEIIDKFDGIKDLKKRIIKTPLTPDETFSDDPLRIMRAIRFATQLNFKISDGTIQGIKNQKDRLRIISQERISDEFLKIMGAEKPSIGLVLLQEIGVMEIIFNEIAKLNGVDQRFDYHHKDVFLHTCQVVDNIAAKSNNLWLRIAGLLHDIAKPRTKDFVEGTGWTFHGHEEIGARMVKHIFKKMKFPFVHIPYVENLVRLHLRPIALIDEIVTDSAIRRLIVSAGESLDDLILLCRSDITSKNLTKVRKYLKNYDRVVEKIKEVEEKDKLRAFQSPVKGEEIMEICNLKPSKKVGEIKAAIENAILEGIIPNEYDAAFEYLNKIKDDYL